MPSKRLLQALAGKRTDRPPFWFMRQAGRYLPEYRQVRAQAGDFLALCFDPPKAAEITLQPLRRFGMDAAILFADILLIPDAMGCRLAFRDGEGPVLEPVRDLDAVRRLDDDGARVAARLAPVYDTVSRVRAALPAEAALIGFAGSPWTVATYMVEGGGGHDFARARRFAFGDPAAFAMLIDRLVAATIDYLDAQIRAGAEAVQLFDTWAGELSSAEFERWCIEPTRAITTALKHRHPAVPVIGFPRRAGANLLAYQARAGIDAIGLDAGVPLDWAATQLQPVSPIQGNLDPMLLAFGGAAMLEATQRILDRWGGRPFVFNLGHGITPDVPVSHVAALSERLRAGTTP
jgi:uroporphyrinogen decarboxylase